MTREPADPARRVLAATASFATREGRRPRVLVVGPAPGAADAGSWALATELADLGFDVDVGAGTDRPDDVARQAVDNDVHALAVPDVPAGIPSIASLQESLRTQGGAGILIVAYGGGLDAPVSGGVAWFMPDAAVAPMALAVVQILAARQDT